MLRHLLPAPRFLVPAALERRRFEARARAAATDAPSVLHLTHASCLDGAACDALVRIASGDGAVRTLWLDPHESLAALEVVARVPGRGRRLVVSDLSFQRGEGERALALADALAQGGWDVAWRDHHHKQWEGAPVEALVARVALTVDATGSECGATLVQRALLPDDAFASELARVVRDHDLWRLEDPRSVRLHAACQEAGSEAFVERLLATRRLDDATLARWADAEESRRARLVAAGLTSARLVAGRRAVVGVAYGRLPTNDVLHAFEERGAHLGVLLKPDGAFSLRSRKDVPVCQRIASRHGGGGHPNASGGRLVVPAALFPAYWARRGDVGPGRALVRDAVKDADAWLAEGSK